MLAINFILPGTGAQDSSKTISFIFTGIHTEDLFQKLWQENGCNKIYISVNLDKDT
jgi:hypothetical protein